MGSQSHPAFPLAALPVRTPRRLRLAFAMLLTLPLLIAPGAPGVPGTPEASAATPDPESCEGYPEERVFLEAQDWWQPTLHGSEDFGHVHVGTCFPRTHLEDGSPNQVSGTLRLDVRVMMHDNPGLLRFVRVHLADRDDTHAVLRDFIDERCEEGGPNWDDHHNSCVWWKQIEIDTTAANYDGFQEIRLGGSVRQEDTDDSMFATTGWQVYLDNGNEVRHRHTQSDGTHRELMVGRGWYEGAGYANARLEGRLPHTVSGVWEPRVRMHAGSGGVDVHHSFASVNGNFHHDDPGQVLLDQSGEFRGRLSIDTTQLPDGPNRLFLRADAPCDGSAGNDCGFRDSGASLNDSTNSGVLAITFHVDNGNDSDGSGGHHHDDSDDGGDDSTKGDGESHEDPDHDGSEDGDHEEDGTEDDADDDISEGGSDDGDSSGPTVERLTGESTNLGRTWQAEATIAVAEDGSAAEGVDVEVTSRSALGADATHRCTTASDGRCSVSTTLPKRDGAATFTVTQLDGASLAAAPTITLSK
jgi:hypothetical protein